MSAAPQTLTTGRGRWIWDRLTRPMPIRTAREAATVGLVATLVALVTWPVSTLAPSTGVDPSWQVGLHLAASGGLEFGRDVVYTYGPLGFLVVPLLVTVSHAVAGVVFVAVAQIALAAAVLLSTLRTLPPVVALFTTWVVLTLPLQRSDVILVGLFYLCVFVLTTQRALRSWFPAAAGALAALGLAIKINVGAFGLLFVGLAVAFGTTRRFSWALAAGASFVGTFALLWLVSGNSLGVVPDWLRASYELAVANGDSLALEEPGREWEYFAAALLLGGASVVVWRHSSTLPRGRRIGVLVAGAAYGLFYFKQGFARHDIHSLFFFTGITLGMLAFAWRERDRVGALAVAGLGALVVVATPDISGRALLRPDTRPRALAAQIELLASPSRRDEAVAAWKASAQGALDVEPAALARLAGRTVHVDPHEASAAWAYGLTWRPLPVFQSYAAYTPYLDELNARSLRGARAPERILRENVPVHVDDIAPEFDSPEAVLALICNYREMHSGVRWQVLARAANRCGPRRLLETTTVGTGAVVAVPRAPGRAIVFARFHVPSTVLGALQKTLYKQPRTPRVILDGNRDHRFVIRSATNAHVLRVPLRIRESAHFVSAVDTDTVRLVDVPAPVRVAFYAVTISR